METPNFENILNQIAQKERNMNVVFVEDMPEYREQFRQVLSTIEGINLLGDAASMEEGYELIKAVKPDLVLLDVELTPWTAFDLLNLLNQDKAINFEIIFLTAFANFDYPVRAIQYSALDFLMKPFEKETLEKAIGRARERFNDKTTLQQQYLESIQQLLHNLQNPPEQKIREISFHRAKGIEKVKVDDILYCEADEQHTKIFLIDKSFTAVKHLGFYAKLLEEDFNFFRVSHSILLNLDYLDKYEHTNGQLIKLKNGMELKASKRGGQALKQHLAYLPSAQSVSINTNNTVKESSILSFLKKLFNF